MPAENLKPGAYKLRQSGVVFICLFGGRFFSCIRTGFGGLLRFLFRLRFLLVRFLRFLVAIAAIIGLVETLTLKYQRRTGTDEPSQSTLGTFGTGPQVFIGDRLKIFKLMITMATEIIVSRHDSYSFWESGSGSSGISTTGL